MMFSIGFDFDENQEPRTKNQILGPKEKKTDKKNRP